MSIELFGGVKIKVKVNSILSNTTDKENQIVEISTLYGITNPLFLQ